MTTLPPSSGSLFATTRWSLVMAAAGGGPEPGSAAALEELCRCYWFPLYACIRRHGRAKEDAEDLVQGFIASLLEHGFPAGLDASKGRLRAFLSAALKHYLANARDRERARKRGGGITHLSLDWHSADERFQLAGDAGQTPDQAFDREWALALLARVLERLAKECAAAPGGAERFVALKPFLTARAKGDYARAAAALGIDEGSARMAAHRLRKRYRALLREEVAHTLADPTRVDEELRELLGIFAGG